MALKPENSDLDTEWQRFQSKYDILQVRNRKYRNLAILFFVTFPICVLSSFALFLTGSLGLKLTLTDPIGLLLVTTFITTSSAAFGASLRANRYRVTGEDLVFLEAWSAYRLIKDAKEQKDPRSIQEARVKLKELGRLLKREWVTGAWYFHGEINNRLDVLSGRLRHEADSVDDPKAASDTQQFLISLMNALVSHDAKNILSFLIEQGKGEIGLPKATPRRIVQQLWKNAKAHKPFTALLASGLVTVALIVYIAATSGIAALKDGNLLAAFAIVFFSAVAGFSELLRH